MIDKDRGSQVQRSKRSTTPARLDTACPACDGSGRPHTVVVDGRFRLVRCSTCRTQYFRPDSRLGPATDGVSEYWEKYKFAMYGDPTVQLDYERRYATALNMAEVAVGPIRSILDVGCGIGNFVAYADRTGRTAYGVDVDRGAVEAAQQRGLRVARSDDLDRLLDGPLDAVTLWDVIEHLYEPEPFVRQMVGQLRPGGVMILETPDADFPLRTAVLAAHQASSGRIDLTRAMYYWEHKIYFTLPGLSTLLERCGCDVVSVRRETSPQAKMQRIFDRKRERRASVSRRAMATAWPMLERSVRSLGMGNKLIVVARREV